MSSSFSIRREVALSIHWIIRRVAGKMKAVSQRKEEDKNGKSNDGRCCP